MGADALTRTVIEKQETEAVRRAFSGMLDAERFVALDTGSGTAVRGSLPGRGYGRPYSRLCRDRLGQGATAARWRRMSPSRPTAAGF